MRTKQTDFSLVQSIPRSIAFWFASNLIIAALTAYVLSLSCQQERAIGWGVSAVSFLSAAVTAKIILTGCKKALFINAAVLAVLFTVVSLLIGFVIDSKAIEASAILSLATFTFSGCFFGSIFTSDSRKRKNRVKI